MKQSSNYCLRFMMPGLAVLFGSCAIAQTPRQPQFITIGPAGVAAFTQARSINNKGQIVGIAVTGRKLAPHTTGFLLTKGKYTNVPPPHVKGSTINDIRLNNRGQIIGCYVMENNRPHSFLLSQGRYTEIQFPHALYTRAFGINNEDDVVGIYSDQPWHMHGFLRKQGTFTPIDFPNANGINVFGINDKDQAVGEYSDKSGHSHGFLWNHGIFTIIDAPLAVATIPFGINNRDQIVGIYFPPHQSVGVGFLWKNGSFTKIVLPNIATNLTIW